MAEKSETFNYYVAVDENYKAYRGTDIADAMAAWSKGIEDGAEYVVIEALRERRG